MSLLGKLDAVLNQHHEETMDYIYMKYHNFESPIPNIPISESEMEKIRFYDGMGQSLSHQHTSANSSTRGKPIIFDRDPNFHNGLPRKR